jgi:hypothetical protein
MNFIDILIEVDGTWCNDWPWFRVIVNNHTYYDQQIADKKIIKFSLPVLEYNQLVLEHYGKSFGQNGRWDTESNGKVIVKDRAVKLIKLEIDGVNIVKYITSWPMVTNEGQSIPTDYLGHNGKITINFTSPVYDWIITTLVKETANATTAQDLIIETSHNNVFDYREDLIELEEITKLLNEYAYLFNKSS